MADVSVKVCLGTTCFVIEKDANYYADSVMKKGIEKSLYV